ncbi:MAG: SMP-30/gluconolactonase/LRE family protein [Anaerolineae bacterium]|nr:SMP-30/gluconolactonase/LRE family protein [Anaerolineae bacterium]
MMPQVALFVDHLAELGEGPGWDAAAQRLYWVDIYGQALHLFTPASGLHRIIPMPAKIGCAVPKTSGGMLVALQNGLFTLDLDSEMLTAIADPEAGLPHNRFNDGKCDPRGRFLAGTMDDREIGIAAGSLYSVEADLSIRRLFDGVTISNGIGFSPDHKTMYYIDSPTRLVVAFDYDLETGDVRNRRIVVTIPEGWGDPDGMTTDTEGMLWVALWSGESVTRWNPATGELLERIPVPALNVSSCTFGGPEMNELFLTTARKGTDPATLAKYPKTGAVFRHKTNVVGMENFVFAG